MKTTHPYKIISLPAVTFFFLVVGIFAFFPRGGTAIETSLSSTATSSGAATTTSATTTELIPDIINESVYLEQKIKNLGIFEQFRGIIPNSILDSFIRGGSSAAPSGVAPLVSGQASQTAVFQKNLRLGDTSADVLLLQKSLNRDLDTRVAEYGSGSLGKETNYFGLLTKAAVIKFQEKHAGKILIPNGLQSGTGFVGASTRAVLNDIESKIMKGQSLLDEHGIPEGPILRLGEKVSITSLEPSSGGAGTLVIIRGTGFTPTANRIYTGTKVINNAASSDGKTLAFVAERLVFAKDPGITLSEASTTDIINNFKLYKTADFPEVKYPIYITNDNGDSNGAFFRFEF